MITRDYILARITEIEQERDAFQQEAAHRDAVYSGGLAALRQLLATIDEAEADNDKLEQERELD